MERGNTCTCDCLYVTFKNSTILVQKIISLMEEQITRNECERQKEYICQLVDICQTGFFMNDLHHITGLIVLLIDRIDEAEEYSYCLNEILRVCGIPPIMSLSSDVLTFAKPLQEFFRILGYTIVCLSNDQLQVSAAEALINVLMRQMQDRRYISSEIRINAVANSQLPQILGQLLEIAEENVYSTILNVIIVLARNSDTVCNIIIKQDAINSLLSRLEPTWKVRYPNKPPPTVPIVNVLHFDRVAIIVLLLLKYLSNNKSEVQNAKSVRLFSLWSLQYTFRYFARTNQHVNRNNTLIILLKILLLFPETDFVTSGLAKDLTHIGLNSAYHLPWAKDVKLSTDDEDCLYIELLICSIPMYLKFFGGIRVLEEQRILPKLLAISRNKFTIKWKPQEACVLCHISLNTLMNIVPFTEEEFIESGGSIVLLNIIESYRSKNSDVNILRKGLEALLHIIQNTSMVLHSVVFNNGVNLIMDLCEDIVFNLFEETMGKKCLSLVFFILHDIYSQPAEESSNKKIIGIAIAYMKKIAKPNPETTMRDIREIISAMNFVWQHIVKNEENAKEFVKQDGVYLMLDMVQIYPFVVKLITLGAMVDLCEHGHCIPYLITWKHKGQTLVPMLMNLFREENKQLKVKVGRFGQITDTRYPLMGKDQWFLTFCTCKPMVAGHACIADLHVSCRPKIYALLQMLHVRHAERVQIANEHYKSFDDVLHPRDQVTRLVAENFLALKLGEAWVEIKEEFDRSSIYLTSFDHQLLTCLINRTHRLAKHLKTVQNDILQQMKEKEHVKEYTLYKHLQDGTLTEALETLSELKAIARSSEHMFRIAEKYRQQRQIENAVRSHSLEVHRTYFSDIRVTPVFNEIINIEKATVATDETNIIPASPIESKVEVNIDIPEDLLQSSTEINLVCQE